MMIAFQVSNNLQVSNYEVAIYLGSAVISLLLALMIFALRRSANVLKKKEWTGPFAHTFFVLALGYFLRFVQYTIYGIQKNPPLSYSIFAGAILICSGWTNYLLFRTGFGLVDDPWLLKLKKSLTGSTIKKRALFFFLCLLALLPLIPPFSKMRIPDAICSAIVLVLVGYGLYKNSSYQRDKLMARLALLSSISYALILIFYGLGHYFSSQSGESSSQKTEIDLLVFLIALPIKFAFFFPGFSSMLLILSRQVYILLEEINQKLARLQIEVSKYNIELDINNIAKEVQGVLTPLATGIFIKVGFSEYYGIAALDGQYAESMKKHLKREPPEENQRSKRVRSWPKTELKISCRAEGGEKEQLLGDITFALDTKEESGATSAIDFDYRNDISNLLTNISLNFIRGYLTQLTDVLGVRLGGLKEANPEGWIREVDETAREAKLLWAVGSYSADNKLLGEDKNAVELVNKLRSSGKWQKKVKKVEDSILTLWSSDTPEEGTWHVIEKRLKDSGQTLWFGVSRRDFGLEMSYISPWRFFIDQFCKIADAALDRILIKREAEERKKAMAEFHGLATAAITTGTVIHQLVNRVRSLTGPIDVLEFAIKSNELRISDDYKALILSMRGTRDKIDEVLKQFAGVVTTDERQPCSLFEAIEHATEILQDSLQRYGIKFDSEVSKEVIINVPFHVAVSALINVIHNAKDAIRDGRIKNGLIRIRVEEDEHKFVCHITDNGLGVPPSAQKMLFKSVYQSDKPYSHGLGLYLSFRSLRENRGNICLTHPGPEPNTTFSIEFPKLRSTL